MIFMEDVWKLAGRDVVMHGRFMNVTESCLDRHARAPDRQALVFEENGKTASYTYASLLEETCRFSNLLKSEGIKPGSRIFIFLPKVPEIYIAVLGSIRHGSIAAPLFEALQEEGLELRLTNGEANVIVTNSELSARIPKDIMSKPFFRKLIIVDSDEFRRKMARQPASFKPAMMKLKDTALMIFTSSTAGTPVEGVCIPHQAIIQQHYTAKLVLGLEEGDRYWCTAHPGWVTGSVYGIIAPLSVGCTSYIYTAHFDADMWLGFLKKNKITVLYTAPTALRMLRSEVRKGELASLRNVCSVGEALTTAVFDFYKGLGIEINDTYWQTETGAMVIATWPGLKKKHGSMGKAVPGIKAGIKGGAIALKPPWPSMMTGIYRHRKMYSDYFRGGWFRTSDMARVDKGGYFFFEGRGGDMIKTSGERVSPIEIESVLMRHKAVKEAAVVGVPDKMKGEIIKAFIVLNKGVTPSDALKQEIELFVKDNYAGYSYPKLIDFVEALPKTHSGKIIRMELRRMSSS
jgi:acetyl-CoA synthetase